MQQYSCFLFCMLITSSGLIYGGRGIGLQLDEASPGDCPGGLANGALLDLGRFFYECRNGDIVPKGCVSDTGKRLEIGATVDRSSQRLQCALGSGGLLTFDPVACLFNGAEHKIGGQWEDGSNFYACKKADSGDVRSVNIGCIDQDRRIPLNEKVSKEDFVFVCNATVNNGARLMPTACVKDGREVNVGDSFEAGNAWSTCTRIGREKLSANVIGCVSNGKRLNDGERYFENDVVYECNIDNGKNNARVTGCVGTEGGSTIERRLGCTWTEGTPPNQYEWLCQKDEAKNSAKKVPVRCNYNVGDGVYNVDPGCYRVVDKGAVGCAKDGENLRIQSFQGKDAQEAEKAASSAGLHAC